MSLMCLPLHTPSSHMDNGPYGGYLPKSNLAAVFCHSLTFTHAPSLLPWLLRCQVSTSAHGELLCTSVNDLLLNVYV